MKKHRNLKSSGFLGEWVGLSWPIITCKITSLSLSVLLSLSCMCMQEKEKGERREKERERNINVWLPLTHPLLGTWPTTQACALTRNQTSNPLVHRPALNPLSHTSQDGKFDFLVHMPANTILQIFSFLNLDDTGKLSKTRRKFQKVRL